MIQPKKKKCKGINKAKDFEGCGKLFYKRTHGLCDSCYANWLLSTPEGQEKLSKSVLNAPKEREKKEKKEWNKRKAEIKQSLKTKQDYEKELEAVFNKFIRLRDAGKPCISCGTPLSGKFDAGHYYPAGSYKNIRFDERNVHGQCVHCNQHKHGNIAEYTLRLPERIGKESFDQLVLDRLKERHYTIPELIELKVIYKDKIKKYETNR